MTDRNDHTMLQTIAFLACILVGIFAIASLIADARSAEGDFWIKTRTACTIEAAVEIAEAAALTGDSGAQAVFDVARATKTCMMEDVWTTHQIVEVMDEYVVKSSGQRFYVVTYGSQGQYAAFAWPGNPSLTNME